MPFRAKAGPLAGTERIALYDESGGNRYVTSQLIADLAGGGGGNTLYSSDDTILVPRVVTVNESLTFLGIDGQPNLFTVDRFSNITLESNIGILPRRSEVSIDEDGGIDIRHVNSTNQDSRLYMTSTFISLIKEGAAVDVSLDFFVTDGGKMALQASVYRFGDGSGNHLPTLDSSPSHLLSVRSADGHMFRTPLADLKRLQYEEIDNTDSPYNVAAGVEVVYIDNSAGAVIVNLPTAGSMVNAGKTASITFFIKADPSVHNVTLEPDGAETIQIAGSAPQSNLVLSLAAEIGTSLTISSDGSNLFVI